MRFGDEREMSEIGTDAQKLVESVRKELSDALTHIQENIRGTINALERLHHDERILKEALGHDLGDKSSESLIEVGTVLDQAAEKSRRDRTQLSIPDAADQARRNRLNAHRDRRNRENQPVDPDSIEDFL